MNLFYSLIEMFELGSTDSNSGTPSSDRTNSENYTLDKNSFKNIEKRKKNLY